MRPYSLSVQAKLDCRTIGNICNLFFAITELHAILNFSVGAVDILQNGPSRVLPFAYTIEISNTFDFPWTVNFHWWNITNQSACFQKHEFYLGGPKAFRRSCNRDIIRGTFCCLTMLKGFDKKLRKQRAKMDFDRGSLREKEGSSSVDSYYNFNGTIHSFCRILQ